MTYDGGKVNGEVAPGLIVRFRAEEDNMRDYVKLRHDDSGGNFEVAPEVEGVAVEPVSPRAVGSCWYWVRLVLLVLCIGLSAGIFAKWVGPLFVEKEIIPILDWEARTFSPPVLAFVVFASVAIFPTFLLPSSPSMWVAGMAFGYGYGFPLIMSGVTVGVSLPYFIGSCFYHNIQGWIEKYPKRAYVLRSAGEGNWFHQFRAVTLIRLSPFPYIIYNYCAVATNVKYVPYLLGSLAGMVPETLVAIYTGILILALADASHEHHGLSAPQIIFTIVGFSLTVATTIFFTVYAKKQLKELQKENEPLLQ
ncbi:hypothetical protein OROMI_018446 [Orobanche minor]